MSKFACGPASWHILSSSGPSSYPLHFYSTSYSINHGATDKTSVSTFRHKGTGYGSNFRPAVYYSSRLDQVDNPIMGELLQDNYKSHTKKEYVDYRIPRGSDPFLSKVQPFVSGFTRNMPRTLPSAHQVTGAHKEIISSRNNLGLNTHSPIAAENFGHRPEAMSSEYQTQFPRQSFRNAGLTSSDHVTKEKTGFTHDTNVEPLTFRPHENHANDLPGHMTQRLTGSSVMKNSFRMPHYLKGGEPFEAVSGRANRSNGFIKGSKAMADVQPTAGEMVGYTKADQVHQHVLERVRKQDPAEYSVMTNPEQYTSLTQRSFSVQSRGTQEGRVVVGAKELTGFSENNSPLVELLNDSQHFSTHYRYWFSNPNPVGSAREGHIASGCGVQYPTSNGFCKGTSVHSFAGPCNGGTQQLEPYVARSLVKRDPFHNDHTHQQKKY